MIFVFRSGQADLLQSGTPSLWRKEAPQRDDTQTCVPDNHIYEKCVPDNPIYDYYVSDNQNYEYCVPDNHIYDHCVPYYDLNNYVCPRQGGRSCTGARVAPAEKFGLGQKF